MRINDRSPFMRVAAHKANAPKAAANEILLYDEIGFFGIQAADFIAQLDAMKGKEIHLRINSPGGSVFDGNAIYEALKRHKAKIIVHVDGIAASIASLIAMSGDEIYMAQGAFIMIHDPWSIVIGSSADMRKEAEVLDILAGSLARIYASRTGLPEKEVSAMMADETWFNADDAVANGFADAVTVGDAVKASFDLSVFAKAPSELKDQPEDIMREVERVLRDAGYSRTGAKAFISAGKAAQNQRDAESLITPPRDAAVSKPEETLAALRGLAETLKA